MNTPLIAEVLGSTLSITIGDGVLAFAFENGNANKVWDQDVREWVKALKVVDSKVFLADVCAELNRESEDGSTPLTRLLDDIMNQAVENGSLGVDNND